MNVDRVARRVTWPAGLGFLALLVAFTVSVVSAPDDVATGITYKILFVHAPCAAAAYVGFFLTGLAGVLYLVTNDEQYDRLAASGAEVGVLFCTLVVVTGPIWARATWGQDWRWLLDLRLALTLLLWLVYLSYLLLRSFTEGTERMARFSAVYGLAGLVVIPLNYFAIELAQGATMHPPNLGQGTTVGGGMRTPLLLGFVTALVGFVYLLALRVRVAGLRTRVEWALTAKEEES
jgi:heme exporter protein C